MITIAKLLVTMGRSGERNDKRKGITERGCRQNWTLRQTERYVHCLLMGYTSVLSSVLVLLLFSYASDSSSASSSVSSPEPACS